MAVTSETSASWTSILGVMRAEVGESGYNAWLKPLALVDSTGDMVVLSCPTRFMRNWVFNHYGPRLLELWKERSPGVADLEIVVPKPRPAARPDGAAEAGRPDDAPPVRAVPTDAADSPLDRGCTFESFLVGPSNRLAHSATRQLADPQAASANLSPLFLHSRVGLGKTHLMQAVAWHAGAGQPGRKVSYLSAERFMGLYVGAVRDQRLMDFRERLRSTDILMVDDVQFICGKEKTEEEFFHTLDELMNRGRQVVISADTAPAGLESINERLRSRLNSGLVVEISPTDQGLRLDILHRTASAQSIDVPEGVLEFIASRISSNTRTMKGALNRIIAQAQLLGTEITLDQCKTLLSDLIAADERRITIDEIQRHVAGRYEVTVEDIRSARRSHNIVLPRHIAMYLARLLTTRSMPEIGRQFGNRDHTTVLHGVRRMEERRATDPEFASEIEQLRSALESR